MIAVVVIGTMVVVDAVTPKLVTRTGKTIDAATSADVLGFVFASHKEV